MVGISTVRVLSFVAIPVKVNPVTVTNPNRLRKGLVTVGQLASYEQRERCGESGAVVCGLRKSYFYEVKVWLLSKLGCTANDCTALSASLALSIAS